MTGFTQAIVFHPPTRQVSANVPTPMRRAH
jgi:hypothetical protein